MNIYVDFDDCLCETARYFSILIKDMFDLDIPYEKIRYFDLKRSFSLSDKQYDEMMIRGHEPKVLLSYEETANASKTLNDLMDEGHDVSVITGRPYSAYEPSREWLDSHGLKRAKLYCLNKYGRDTFIKNSEYSLEIDDYKKMHFDIAIEDSPAAFGFFDHMPDLKVMVFDRPWNREAEFPSDNYLRFHDWDSIREAICLKEKL